MSIWKEGRYKSNVKWVAQELFNGGVEKLLKSLEPEDQVVKDDILFMMNQLVMHEDELEQRPKKPHLYIVKNDEKSENNG